MTDPLPVLPGQELERAAANVATTAGKSLVRGLGNVAGAFMADWIAKKEANAVATRMAIETAAAIHRDEALAAQGRKQQLDTLENLEIVQRRLERLRQELLWQQRNFEAIAVRAIEITEEDPRSAQPRTIEDDWIFRFSRMSQDASSGEIRELWSRILSSAAIEGKRKISAAALQIMSLIDPNTAVDFRNFCIVASTFSFFTGYDRVYEKEPQNIDIENLEELGLVVADPISGSYPFGDFELRVGPVGGVRVGVLRTTFSLTRRGAEITEAVFSNENMELDKAIVQLYLQAVVSNQINDYYSVTVTLPPRGQATVPFSLSIAPPRHFTSGPPPPKFDLLSIKEFASKRLWSLLLWAERKYEILPQPLLPNPNGQPFSP